jgi:hypothetical protein
MQSLDMSHANPLCYVFEQCQFVNIDQEYHFPSLTKLIEKTNNFAHFGWLVYAPTS